MHWKRGAGLLLTAFASLASTAGADEDALGWIVGSWKGTRTETSTGKSAALRTDIRSVLASLGEEEELEVEDGATPYRGLYLQVFDPKLGKSVLMYVNARRRQFARLEGTAAADRGEWDSTTAQPPHRSRLRYEKTGKDSWRRTQMVSEDDGKSWQVLFVDELRRR